VGPLSGEFNGSAHTSHPWLGGEPLLVFGKSHGSQRTSLRMQILIKVQMCLFSRFRTTACTMNLIQSNTEFVNIVCSWSSLPAKDPLIAARNTVFFRTVELAYNQGIDISWGECQVRGDMAYVVVQRHVKRSLNMFTLSELLRDCSFSFVLCNMEPGRLTWKPWIFFFALFCRILHRKCLSHMQHDYLFRSMVSLYYGVPDAGAVVSAKPPSLSPTSLFAFGYKITARSTWSKKGRNHRPIKFQ